MNEIIRVTVCGKTLESRNLKSLLRRAISEKRNMDRALRYLAFPVGRVGENADPLPPTAGLIDYEVVRRLM